MNKTKNLIAGVAMLAGLMTLTTSASADWSRRGSDLRRDHRELSAARGELRSDLHRGAGRAEIAHDRAAIARERRDIWQDRRDWRNDWWRNRYDQRYRGWDRDDRGRHLGWWNRGWWDHR